MLIKTVTTVTALNSAGQLVEALPVRTAGVGENDLADPASAPYVLRLASAGLFHIQQSGTPHAHRQLVAGA